MNLRRLLSSYNGKKPVHNGVYGEVLSTGSFDTDMQSQIPFKLLKIKPWVGRDYQCDKRKEGEQVQILCKYERKFVVKFTGSFLAGHYAVINSNGLKYDVYEVEMLVPNLEDFLKENISE